MSSILALLTVIICWLAGRLVMSKPESPLVPAVAGAGMWYIVWLLGTLAGLNGPLLAVVFAGAAVGGTVMFKRSFTGEWPQLKSSVVFLFLFSPCLALLNGDIVIRWDEISHYMRNADMLRVLGTLPTREDILRLDWLYPEFPLAFTALGFPAQWVAGGWLPAVWACLNLIFMALAADTIYRLYAKPGKLDVAAIGIIGVLVAFVNPFLKPTVLASGYVDPMLGIAVFAAGWPLLAAQKLPRTLRELAPYSLIWACVVGLKEIGIFIMAIVLAAWAVRAWYETKGDWRGVAVQLVGLVVPAIIMWLAWKGWQGSLDMPKTWNPSDSLAGIHWERFGDTFTNMFKGWWGRPHAFVLLIGYLVALGLMVRRRVLNPTVVVPLWIMLAYSGLIFLIFVTIFPDGMGRSAHSYWRYMAHIQYFMLAGASLWLLVALRKKSVLWQTRAAYGLVAVLIVGQAFIIPELQPVPNERLRVAMALAEAWKNEKLPPFTCTPRHFDTEQMEMLRYEFRMRTVMKRCEAQS